MDDINIVILSGVIVGTPETKEIGEKRTFLCTGRLKSTRSWNGKEFSTTKNFKAFSNVAKVLADMRGGDRVRIQGSLGTESWESKKEPGKKEYREIIEVREATGERANETQTHSVPQYQPKPAAPKPQDDDPSIPF